jgi:hypothetical protein
MAGRVVQLRRIVVSVLHVSDRAVHVAVTNLRAALQGARNLLQKPVAILNAQRPGGAEKGVALGTGPWTAPIDPEVVRRNE